MGVRRDFARRFSLVGKKARLQYLGKIEIQSGNLGTREFSVNQEKAGSTAWELGTGLAWLTQVRTRPAAFYSSQFALWHAPSLGWG